jgi:histidinol-phosphatase (PHP family)
MGIFDYHLHLWPHEEAETWLSIDQIADYCDEAARHGVTEVALTEHLHRFTQVTDIVGRFWETTESNPVLQRSMARYFDHHARSDLDAYVELALEAKAQGLPVKVGLEVDYYRGQMDQVGALLDQYPFDVLLGSIHWIGGWRFDDHSDADQLAEWDVRQVDACWDAYCEAIEELAATKTCDVLAHPDLIKYAGRIPENPAEWWDRLAEAAKASGMAAELSSAGWRTMAKEQYPAVPLLERFLAREVPMTTASDAHRLARVAERMEDLVALASSVGLTELASFEARVRSSVPLGQP